MVDVAELGFAFSTSGEKQVAREMESIRKAGIGVENQYKAIDAAAGGLTKTEAQTVRALQDKIIKTQMGSRELAVHNALTKAGADASSVAGGAIAELARTHHDLAKAQEKANDSSSNLANTLTRRLIVGFLITQLKSAAEAVWNLNHEMAKLGDTASRIGATGQGIQGMVAGAAVKGVDPGQFLDAMLKLNGEVSRAKIGLGDLGALFRANGVQARDAEDAYFKIADLVMNARDEATKFAIVQQAGLPPTREMVKVLEQGAEALRKQASEAKGFTDAQLLAAKKLDEEFNILWFNFTQGGKKAIVEIFDKEGWKQAGRDIAGYFWSGFNLITGNKQPTADLKPLSVPQSGDMGNWVTGAKTKTTVNPQEQKDLLNIEAQRLSLLGQTITALEARRQVEIQLAVAAINNVHIDGKRAELLKRIAEENSLGITSIKASSDATLVEAASIGMTTAAAEQYRAVQTAILENRRKGITLQADEIQRIQEEAAILGTRKAELEARKTEQAMVQADPLASLQQRLSELDEQLARGKLSWQAYQFAATQAAANTAAGVLSMTGSLATNLSKLFKNNKALAIAGAVMDTAAGVAKALGSAPPPWNFIAAASVAAAGAAQIATIRSTEPGTSGSISSPSASGAPAASALAATPSVPEKGIYIDIHGKNFSGEQVRELIEAINEHTRDGGAKIQVV